MSAVKEEQSVIVVEVTSLPSGADFETRLGHFIEAAGFQGQGKIARLVKATGFNRNAIGKWLNGDVVPHDSSVVKFVDKIAELGEVSISDSAKCVDYLSGKTVGVMPETPSQSDLIASLFEMGIETSEFSRITRVILRVMSDFDDFPYEEGSPDWVAIESKAIEKLARSLVNSRKKGKDVNDIDLENRAEGLIEGLLDD